MKFPLNQGIPEWLDQSWPIWIPWCRTFAKAPWTTPLLWFLSWSVVPPVLCRCAPGTFLWRSMRYVQFGITNGWLVFFAKKNLCFCRYFLAKFHVDADASQTGRVEFKDQADLARIEQQQLVNKIIRILGVTLKPLFSQPAQMEHQCWLVVLTILKNMSSSMGRMTSHIWNGK